MKYVDWQALFFIGGSLLNDYWILFGLPKVYYWDIKMEMNNDDDKVA